MEQNHLIIFDTGYAYQQMVVKNSQCIFKKKLNVVLFGISSIFQLILTSALIHSLTNRRFSE